MKTRSGKCYFRDRTENYYKDYSDDESESESESESEYTENFFNKHDFDDSDFDDCESLCNSEEELNFDEQDIERYDHNTNVFTQYGDFSGQSHEQFMKEELKRQKFDKERRQETREGQMHRRREERKTVKDKFYNRNAEYNKQKKQRQDKRKTRDVDYEQSQATNPILYKGTECVNNTVLSSFLSKEGHYNGKDVDIATFKKLLMLHPRTSLKRVLKKYKTTILTFHPDKFSSGENEHVALALTQILNRGKTEIQQLYANNTTSVDC